VKKIDCIVIDDEPLPRKIVTTFVKKTPFLDLVAEYESAFDAVEMLKSGNIHLMFIDISMPDVNGMEFVRSLTDRPHVVFTTAHTDFALEAFRVDAVDYLVKPVEYAGFLRAVNKVRTLVEAAESEARESIKTTLGHLFVKADHKLVHINLHDIMHLESMHEYVKIYVPSGKPVTTMVSMKSMRDLLPADRFMRVYRSFIVNLARISAVERRRCVRPDRRPGQERFSETHRQELRRLTTSAVRPATRLTSRSASQAPAHVADDASREL
jgi:DNA-binding LytR/AlgR family response regulator